MPTYEYLCHKCDQRFEVEQSMMDDPLKIHEDCGGEVVRVFSTAGIVLKGSGFYKTENKIKSATKPKETGGEKAKPAEKPKPSTSSEKSDKK